MTGNAEAIPLDDIEESPFKWMYFERFFTEFNAYSEKYNGFSMLKKKCIFIISGKNIIFPNNCDSCQTRSVPTSQVRQDFGNMLFTRIILTFFFDR